MSPLLMSMMKLIMTEDEQKKKEILAKFQVKSALFMHLFYAGACARGFCMIFKVSRLLGKSSDCQSFHTALEVSKLPGLFPDHLESFQQTEKISSLEAFQIIHALKYLVFISGCTAASNTVFWF